MTKHFAIATVAITALFALFATGEDWGAQAQLDEVEARNRLAAAEAEKLGARRLEAKLKIKRRNTGSMDSGGSSGGEGEGSFDPVPQGAAPRRMPPGTPAALRNAALRAAEHPEAAPANVSPQAAKNRKPSEAQVEAMLDASRERSGGDSSDD